MWTCILWIKIKQFLCYGSIIPVAVISPCLVRPRKGCANCSSPPQGLEVPSSASCMQGGLRAPGGRAELMGGFQLSIALIALGLSKVKGRNGSRLVFIYLRKKVVICICDVQTWNRCFHGMSVLSFDNIPFFLALPFLINSIVSNTLIVPPLTP